MVFIVVFFVIDDLWDGDEVRRDEMMFVFSIGSVIGVVGLSRGVVSVKVRSFSPCC